MDEYKKAGVDINAGEKAVDLIKKTVASTYDSNVVTGLGGFGAEYQIGNLVKNNDHPVLISGTDGVGTKLLLALQVHHHETIGIDLVAMCANDILAQGARPLFFLDYMGLGKLKPENVKTIVSGITNGCKQAHLSLIGGEMAEMPGLYHHGEYDLSGFAVGLANQNHLLGKQNVEKGDVLIGLSSSGIHSNGYSLVRRIISENHLDLNQEIPELHETLGKALLKPTKLYYDTVNPLIEKGCIHAAAHITGGGITENLARIIPDGLSAEINEASWKILPIFKLLKKWGHVSTDEMRKVFNMGLGMILAIPQDQLANAKQLLDQSKDSYYQIGEVAERNGNPVEFEQS
ncbi:phosphoribosylformylglycinamidine cyclo-ligase [Philodulcilactobacillus myokoensis]|uniref:Phosphoribosylformylglycinamidine cyclo-ligase n=1 Tax=Philodulcilactobacillus myokoensis TaxID=2929573 RepID=A0A9W6B3E0_9LACO|nr:phosphoribosylformylglycinamidine cyclo-ligase [Philodulcilactobacillus myokoensis]GLB47458.1 phosphoribosylformylglycinamidine cyclo-ligase [Philodulcilactobacillus myokoensis]